MLWLALLAVGTPQTAVEAERAFARQAATGDQWAAFRDWSTPDAIMFNPQPVNAHELVAKLRRPRVPIQWFPAESYVACDRTQAINTGPSVVLGGGGGHFVTIWVRQPDGGWKWVLDQGGSNESPRAAGDQPQTVSASCRGRPTEVPAVRYAEGQSGEGGSADRTLQWRWHVAPDGARTLDAWLWSGRAMRPVMQERIPAPPARP
jgi:hypothetical protein